MKIQRLAVILSLVLLPTLAKTITVEEYLREVEIKNGGVRATKLSGEAKKLRQDEGSLFFKPSFFLNGEYYDDQRVTNAPSFQGNQTIRHTVRTGISQNLSTGTKASLSYNYYQTQIIGANANLLPNRRFIDVSPMIEITQSLWRNWLGSEYEASVTVQNATTQSQRFNEVFNHKQLMMKAENAYWRLYFAQSNMAVLKESLERAKRLRDWNAERVRSNLVDESELLQAEANLQNREMEYQDTTTDVDAALREFNAMRETEGDGDIHLVKDKDSDYILNARLPQKGEMREDVKSALLLQKAAAANFVLGVQKNRPNFEFYGTYSMNGRNAQYSDAYQQAVSATRPFSIVGVRFSTPMDFSGMYDYKNSYRQDTVAAEMAYKRKAYEVDRDWEILSERFENFKTRLRLAKKLETIQGKKLLNEKRRYTQGRTTTFQVLQFEQDFANAQIIKLKNERELILVYNQLKLYSGDYNE